MLNLTRTPLPTAVNKPVPAPRNQRVGSQEQLLAKFLETQPNAGVVGKQEDTEK